MKVAIASVQVPFIRGGAERLAERLRRELLLRGHQAEIVTFPFKWSPASALLDSMERGRKLDLTEVNGEPIDRVIALKFPAYYLSHPAKTIWLLHQHRQAYDLWGTPYGDLQNLPGGRKIRRLIRKADNRAFESAGGLYSISRCTARRLERHNGLRAEVLYPPPDGDGSLHCEGYGDFIFYPSRFEPMKRQSLLIEAARHLHSSVRIVLAGGGSKAETLRLQELAARHRVEDRVTLLGYISEEEKIRHYANCLAVYFGAYDEDYGYITLEAFLSVKTVLAHDDAGGPLEFIENGTSGHVMPPDPAALASCIDHLAFHPQRAREMGEAGRRRLSRMEMGWDGVIGKLMDHS
ncbi:MAG: glycosyltransferase family 4 protein [Acidobacteriota bacterium]